MIEPETASATVYRYTLPLSDGAAAGDAGSRREGALLELRDEHGNSGWGEAAPLPGFSRESVEEAARQLAAFSSGEGVEEPYPSVRFALELGHLSLRAAASGETLPRLLSSVPRGSVELNALISSGPDEAPAEARRMREAGYRAVKLKVGRRQVDEEARLVRHVAGELEGVSLRLDANRAWSLTEALEFARGILGVEVEYVEEPLADATLLPRFARESRLPVALDESLVGIPAAGLAEHGYATAVVLKPTLLGGISRSLALAARADDLGMKAVVSSAFESGVGTLGLVALAAALPGGGEPAGLDTYRRLGADTLRPALDLGSTLDVSALLGQHREIDPLYLEPVGAKP
ncbi:o-succinylbenzoate synthase [Rubrobacter aplysinae]|uniref:o-succinylbenzoate synthase n=1 Tax=Rubrobacter aplysinae TaxID=909625 RepID=UPI00069D1DE5|nr:o-succinylbenzoate synthase [Rubrobacter aplysinae]